MNTWYRQEGSKWVLYLSGERLAEYESREQLLRATGNHNQSPQWRPEWARNTAERPQFVGTPHRSTA